ncbi:TIGR00730 family Rossman fold protein [Gracilibacillus caseinilyticus]|uniref:Cytokinin riboside 5'-monophosphate phosphoribohydrolase n=1 Tax=Gracilibacillus caseinilyticus TaxID=2932256 RepID=A0ABY4EY25_9BACI|nr:TIGR00730 family Rossman fold protein [Gracilibacillus caseinilyticus]UOQ49315.1 TIGR00730 family Rossman fold protein [Gracilibacillus caseinilyticus]
MKTVAVFCGASNGVDPMYIKESKNLGKQLAKNGIGLVYGGSNVGCMGAVADGVLEAGGIAIGVLPEKLMNYEIAHEKLTELHIVKTMHERKAMMADLADGFIALPGGTGTLEEWFEVFTWQQIGYHQKPCALLNINRYYDPLLTLFDHMVEQGFVKPAFKELIILESEAAQLLDRLKNNPPAPINRWS